MFRCVARLAAAAMFVALLGVSVALLGVSAAQAQVQPYGTNDYGGFRNILPPGTNGFDDAAQLAQFEAAGTRPEHSSDQLHERHLERRHDRHGRRHRPWQQRR